MLTYERNIDYWNDIFIKADINPIISRSLGHIDLDEATDWLCQNSKTILDFGCGNGTWLFKCHLRGTEFHKGIDISEEGIRVARKVQKESEKENFTFTVGGVESLKAISDDSFDSIILSNIVDNLIPTDAIKVLVEVKRILKAKGKVLVKLNPFLTDEQIKEWDIKIIKDNFLDDGLFLWNQTTEEWTKLLENYFSIVKYKDIYYSEHEQYNRLFLLCNDKKGKIMDKKTNNLIGKCGFYCGSCPTYIEGKCIGCRTAHNKGDCYTFDCVDSKKIDYCGLCKDFPCDEIMTREKATVLDLRWLQWKKSQKDNGSIQNNR